MKTFNTTGVVLREYETGECDKRLSLLCKEHGRINIYARGARKPKSKFLAGAQLFTYGEYTIADGGTFFSLTQAAPLAQYPPAGGYDGLRWGQYLLEICEKALPERTPCDDTLQLVLQALYFLKQGDLPFQQVGQVFLFRFLLNNGLAPHVNGTCTRCGNGFALHFTDEGLLCHHCKTTWHKDVFVPSPATLQAIKHVLNQPLKQAFLFRLPATALEEFDRAARLCWRGHFQMPLVSV